MLKDDLLKNRWKLLNSKLSKQFAYGENLNIEGIIYLIGVQELGQLNRNFNKDDKINLIHIAICRLLEPYGYYEFDYFDEHGWPHFKLKESIPNLKPGEQILLLKQAIVNYFIENDYIL